MEKLPSANVNSNMVIAMYFFLKSLPMFVSGMAIYLGYNLFVLGVTGKASISIHADTINGQILNAAPGLIFAVSGIVALIISIWKGVKVEFSQTKTPKPPELPEHVRLNLPRG